jgi:hypothetical protein
MSTEVVRPHLQSQAQAESAVYFVQNFAWQGLDSPGQITSVQGQPLQEVDARSPVPGKNLPDVINVNFFVLCPLCRPRCLLFTTGHPGA